MMINNRLKPITFCVFAMLIGSAPLHATLDAEVPEMPNFLTFIYKLFQNDAWAQFLHHWDTLVMSLIVAIFISFFFILGASRKKMLPAGLQNFLEWIVEGLQYFIVDIIGPEGVKFVPFLGTLFVYILVMNWLVLIPFLKPPTSNFNVTVALAICVFVLVQYRNIKNFGVLGFLYHLAGSPKDVVGWIMVPLMFPIELLTQFTRPVTLSLRLFGNVVGEDILIGAFALFGVSLMADFNAPVGFPLQIPFLFLAMLTGLMQAFVFTLLSTVYILLSMPEHEETSHG